MVESNFQQQNQQLPVQNNVQQSNATVSNENEKQNAAQVQQQQYMAGTMQRHQTETQQLKPELKGKRSFEIGGDLVIVDERYQVTQMIGSGAYGVVFAARDHKTNEEVAIKKIQTAFDSVVDAKRILREIKILKFFDHENIVRLIDILRPPHETNYKDVYIVTEKMEADLNRLIASKQALSDQHYQYFMYQLLRGLLFLHSADVMHRDIKPCNLLVNTNCDLKICDFGLARGIDTNSYNLAVETDKEFNLALTKYVVTRWYRAPEVVLDTRQKNYDEGIDLWAVGCCFAELMGRQPLFLGKNHLNQIQEIQQFIGKLSDEELDYFQDDASKQYLLKNEIAMKITVKEPPQLVWKRRFPNASPAAIDLLSKLLSFLPNKRLTVYQAIQHEYFAQIIALETPPTSQYRFNWEWEYKNMKLLNSIQVVKKLIYCESLVFHPDEEQPSPKQAEVPKPSLVCNSPDKSQLSAQGIIQTQAQEENKDQSPQILYNNPQPAQPAMSRSISQNASCSNQQQQQNPQLVHQPSVTSEFTQAIAANNTEMRQQPFTPRGVTPIASMNRMQAHNRFATPERSVQKSASRHADSSLNKRQAAISNSAQQIPNNELSLLGKRTRPMAQNDQASPAVDVEDVDQSDNGPPSESMQTKRFKAQE